MARRRALSRAGVPAEQVAATARARPPLPSSETETATCTFSRPAATRIGVDSGACRGIRGEAVEHLARRAGGRPLQGAAPRAGRRGLRGRRPLRKVLRARSTRPDTSEGLRRDRERAGVQDLVGARRRGVGVRGVQAVAVTLVSDHAGTGQQRQPLQIARGRAGNGLGTRRGQKASVPQQAGRLAATAAAAADCSRNRPRSPDRQCGSAVRPPGDQHHVVRSVRTRRGTCASSLQRPSQ